MTSEIHSEAKALRIAVVGTGVAGMSAAWLLSERHQVTVYEKSDRIGGHSNTVMAGRDWHKLPVDTGFIVYNEPCYPNLTALFKHLSVPTKPSDMSFAVSLNGGRFEYSGCGFKGLFAQRRNLLNPSFWLMLRDLLRFYRETPGQAGKLGFATLGDYLEQGKFGRAFQEKHLLPMAAAIWSAPAHQLRDFPIESFIRFCDNHGLLTLGPRPQWRTVEGGSRTYVARLTASYQDRIKTGCGAVSLRQDGAHIVLRDAACGEARYDHVVLACHADEALALIEAPTHDEQALLSAFRYARNEAVLHGDASLMPKRRAAWASWNYLSQSDRGEQKALCVTYWMNRLQGLPQETPLFVTLNPAREPVESKVLHRETYHHPIFDVEALKAQKRLWSLQGRRGLWFCGAYFGSGFHEDGLQAGLAVAEELGGVKRPWQVPNDSARIFRHPYLVAREEAA